MDTTPAPGPQHPGHPESRSPGARAAEHPGAGGAGASLGDTLRTARGMLNMSLRAVEAKTGNAVTNGYLSQIEKGAVTRPSPRVLYHLAEVYGLDYADLLVKAGHHVPREQVTADAPALDGLPMSALADLNADERAELAEYIQFLRFRRNAGGDHRSPGGRA